MKISCNLSVIGLLTAVLGGCGTAQMPLPGVGDVPASIDLPGQDQTVQFDFVDGYVLVHGMVDNSGPYTFVLDTGAGASIISPNIADKLPQDFNGAATIVSSVDPNQVNTQFIRVENLTLGSIQFHNFQAAILPEIVIRSPDGQVTVDGIVGLQLFRNLLLTVNYPSSVVRVRQGSLPTSNNCLILPVQRSDAELLLLTLDVNGRSADAVVDTGNNEFLLLPTSFSNLPFDGPTHTGSATTVTGNLTTTVGILNGNVDLGCIEVLKPQITVAGNVASLGSGLFSQLILSIDQNASVLQFEQATQ